MHWAVAGTLMPKEVVLNDLQSLFQSGSEGSELLFPCQSQRATGSAGSQAHVFLFSLACLGLPLPASPALFLSPVCPPAASLTHFLVVYLHGWKGRRGSFCMQASHLLGGSIEEMGSVLWNPGQAYPPGTMNGQGKLEERGAQKKCMARGW